MSPAAKSSFYFGLYALGMGASLFFTPNLILGVFGFEPASEIWMRILGLLAFCLGILYVYCARAEQTGFFRITTYERVVFYLGMVALVIFLRQPHADSLRVRGPARRRLDLSRHAKMIRHIATGQLQNIETMLQEKFGKDPTPHRVKYRTLKR